MKNKLIAVLVAVLTIDVFADTWTDPETGIEWIYIIEKNRASIRFEPDSPVSGAITIPSIIGKYEVKYIDEYAFARCIGLTSITIPEGVTRIGNGAFWKCNSLTSVTIPASVNSLGEDRVDRGMMICTFDGCGKLKSINVDPANKFYCSIDGVLYDKKVKKLICCPLGVKTLAIPASLSDINELVFPNLESITVNSKNPHYRLIDGVLYNKSATKLLRCSHDAKEVTIPSGVKSIGYRAFANCTELTTITIPKSVKEIDNDAFNGCRKLTSVTLPKGMKEIGGRVFGERVTIITH